VNRRWNVLVWAGSVVSIGSLVSYYLFFLRFPFVRDAPWLIFLLFFVGLGMSLAGLKRAFREPQVYRGKIIGTLCVALSLILGGLFAFGIFYYVRQLPASKGAPQVGQKAPDFTLPDQDGNPVTLSKLLDSPSGAEGTDKAQAAVLIFYRGYW
jgi:hypothetical protein